MEIMKYRIMKFIYKHERLLNYFFLLFLYFLFGNHVLNSKDMFNSLKTPNRILFLKNSSKKFTLWYRSCYTHPSWSVSRCLEILRVNPSVSPELESYYVGSQGPRLRLIFMGFGFLLTHTFRFSNSYIQISAQPSSFE